VSPSSHPGPPYSRLWLWNRGELAELRSLRAGLGRRSLILEPCRCLLAIEAALCAGFAFLRTFTDRHGRSGLSLVLFSQVFRIDEVDPRNHRL